MFESQVLMTSPLRVDSHAVSSPGINKHGRINEYAQDSVATTSPDGCILARWGTHLTQELTLDMLSSRANGFEIINDDGSKEVLELTRESVLNTRKRLDELRKQHVFEGLRIVCDGMGGAKSEDGDFASGLTSVIVQKEVLRMLEDALKRNEPINVAYILPMAIERAHRLLRQFNLKNGTTNNNVFTPGDRGTTIVAALTDNTFKTAISWVGDSRAYLKRKNNDVVQLTTDDSSTNDRVLMGVVNPSEQAKDFQRTSITKNIGLSNPEQVYIQPQTVTIQLQENDTVILCVDGIWEGKQDTYGSKRDSELTTIIQGIDKQFMAEIMDIDMRIPDQYRSMRNQILNALVTNDTRQITQILLNLAKNTSQNQWEFEAKIRELVHDRLPQEYNHVMTQYPEPAEKIQLKKEALQRANGLLFQATHLWGLPPELSNDPEAINTFISQMKVIMDSEDNATAATFVAHNLNESRSKPAHLTIGSLLYRVDQKQGGPAIQCQITGYNPYTNEYVLEYSFGGKRFYDTITQKDLMMHERNNPPQDDVDFDNAYSWGDVELLMRQKYDGFFYPDQMGKMMYIGKSDMMGIIDHLRDNRYVGLNKENEARLRYIPLPARKKIEQFIRKAAV